MISSSCFFDKSLITPEEQLTIDSQSISPWIESACQKGYKRHGSLASSPGRNRLHANFKKKSTFACLEPCSEEWQLGLPRICKGSLPHSRNLSQPCRDEVPPEKFVECYLELVRNGRAYRAKYMALRNVEGNEDYFSNFMKVRGEELEH